jgi:hypothetical protein
MIQMVKFSTFILSTVIALNTTNAIADTDTQSVVRMVIVGTPSGEGVFDANAVSISAGSGSSVIGGYVADAESGAIGTAVAAGSSDAGVSTGSLPGFNTSSSPYETVVCSSETCPSGIID